MLHLVYLIGVFIVAHHPVHSRKYIKPLNRILRCIYPRPHHKQLHCFCRLEWWWNLGDSIAKLRVQPNPAFHIGIAMLNFSFIIWGAQKQFVFALKFNIFINFFAQWCAPHLLTPMPGGDVGLLVSVSSPLPSNRIHGLCRMISCKYHEIGRRALPFLNTVRVASIRATFSAKSFATSSQWGVCWSSLLLSRPQCVCCTGLT